MATIRKESNRGQKPWCCDFRLRGRRSREFFATRQEAEDFKKELLLRKVAKTTGQLTYQVAPLGEAVDRYINTVTATKSALVRKYEPTVLKEFSERFDGWMTHEIGKAELQEYQAFLRRRMLGQTVNRRFNVIRHLFGICLDWNIIYDNPCSRLRRLPETNQRAKRALTEEQLTRLMEVAKPWVRNALWAAFVFGLRRSEVCHLKWGAVDPAQGFLHIESGCGFETKTHRTKTLPINAGSARFLEQLYNEACRNGRGTRSDFVFVEDSGCFIRPDRLTKEAKRLMKNVLGLESGAVHILRHTAVTLWHRHGIGLDLVRQLAGHSNVRTTQIYLHNDPEHLRDAMNRMPVIVPKSLIPPEKAGAMVTIGH